MKRPLSLLVSLVIVVSMAVPPRLARAADQSTTIYRDEFGIPHIFAPTLEDAAFAAGYAQAEDRLEELLKNYRRASGTMAEVFGPDLFRRRPPPARHAARRGQPGSLQRDQPEDARCDRGLSTRHQAVHERAPRAGSRRGPRRSSPWDVVALGRYIIWNWPMGEAAADLKRAGVEFGPLSLPRLERDADRAQAHRHERPHRHHRPARPVVRRDAVLRGADLHARVQRGGRLDPGRALAPAWGTAAIARSP